MNKILEFFGNTTSFLKHSSMHSRILKYCLDNGIVSIAYFERSSFVKHTNSKHCDNIFEMFSLN